MYINTFSDIDHNQSLLKQFEVITKQLLNIGYKLNSSFQIENDNDDFLESQLNKIKAIMHYIEMDYNVLTIYGLQSKEAAALIKQFNPIQPITSTD